MLRDEPPVWAPGPADVRDCRLATFIRWLEAECGLSFDGYRALQSWSIEDLAGFWAAVCEYFGVEFSHPPSAVLEGVEMPAVRWFPNARLNAAEVLLRRGKPQATALVCGAEEQPLVTVSFGDLRRRVAGVQAGLRELGVEPGDRVVAILPNGAEAVIAFLAVAGLGAIWASCAPEFGVTGVIDRFEQLEPSVLIAVDGYRFGGRLVDRRAELSAIAQGLPSLRSVVVVPAVDTSAPEGAVDWRSFDRPSAAEPTFEQVEFSDPLWVVFTSGTTGKPKPLVHGHGGIALESLVQSAFHLDLGPDDRFFWFTTTGWIMWNIQLGALAVGTPIVLYEGSPAYPDASALWRFVERAGATFFGTSAAYIQATIKAGVVPRETADLGALRQIGLTGSPLEPYGFAWIQENVRERLFIANISGGTDVCGALVSSTRMLPVYAGETQGAALGVAAETYDATGSPVIGEVGELVVSKPMPSMPVALWNDDGSRYRESYFDHFPGVWRHGDWSLTTPDGGIAILGRSDSTLNRGGVRMGTAEFYSVVDAVPGVIDSLIVDVTDAAGAGRLMLFVVIADGIDIDELRPLIASTCRAEISPRHVPDELYVVKQIPRTLSGKKVEVPIKRILEGKDPAVALERDALANPEALDAFLELAAAPPSRMRAS